MPDGRFHLFSSTPRCMLSATSSWKSRGGFLSILVRSGPGAGLVWSDTSLFLVWHEKPDYTQDADTLGFGQDFYAPILTPSRSQSTFLLILVLHQHGPPLLWFARNYKRNTTQAQVDLYGPRSIGGIPAGGLQSASPSLIAWRQIFGLKASETQAYT